MNRSSWLTAAWRPAVFRALSSRYPVILLYHGVPVEAQTTSIHAGIFEEHVRFLHTQCEPIHPNLVGEKRKITGKIRVLLTFDDGFRNNADVVAPILRRYQVPAIFFVCSRHATPGKYLWFSYLRALEAHFPGDRISFRGKILDMSSSSRAATVDKLRNDLLKLAPHPQAMYRAIEEELPRLEDFVDDGQIRDHYAGMTGEQVGQLAKEPLFTIGAHTVDHPFLTQCELEEAKRQISQNKQWIERASNRPCRVIAYPSGAYSEQVIRECDEMGFVNGHAVTSTGAYGRNFELPRIGIYSTVLDILGFKVQWGRLIRRLRLPIG